MASELHGTLGEAGTSEKLKKGGEDEEEADFAMHSNNCQEFELNH